MPENQREKHKYFSEKINNSICTEICNVSEETFYFNGETDNNV